MNTREELTLIVPSGIGDFSWIYSKFSSLGVPMHIRVQEGGPPRAEALTELLPLVKSVAHERIAYTALVKRSISPLTSAASIRKHIASTPICVQANTHLETGKRVETWLPELTMNYHYPLNISPKRVVEAVKLLPLSPFICFYSSAESTARAWNGWLENQWFEFMMGFRKRGIEIPFVMVGAGYDAGLGTKIEQLARKAKIAFFNLVGKLHLGSSLHVIRCSEYFLSFPSGLGILADVLECNATMFYPECLRRMIGSWADPQSLASGRFREMIFPNPDWTADWVVNHFKIVEKIEERNKEEK